MHHIIVQYQEQYTYSDWNVNYGSVRSRNVGKRPDRYQIVDDASWICTITGNKEDNWDVFSSG